MRPSEPGTYLYRRKSWRNWYEVDIIQTPGGLAARFQAFAFPVSLDRFPADQEWATCDIIGIVPPAHSPYLTRIRV